MEISRDKALGRWEMPEPLRVDVDPERLAAADAAQAELARKAQSPFLTLSPSESERERAGRAAVHISAALTMLRAAMKQHRARRRPSRRQRLEFAEACEAERALARRLAEAHAEAGRYDLAADAEDRPAVKDFYRRVWAAVWRDDADDCPCPSTHEHQYALKDIFSVNHGREVALVGCNDCGFLNVKAAPEHLQAARAHRSAAAALVAGLPPEDAKRILESRGHTTGQLLVTKGAGQG